MIILGKPAMPVKFFRADSLLFSIRSSVKISGWINRLAFTNNLSSVSNLSISIHNELCRGQIFQPHRPERVKLRGGDADLGSQTKLASIVEARGGVNQHAGRVDFADESLGIAVVGGNDYFAVQRRIGVDMVNSGVHVIPHSAGEN